MSDNMKNQPEPKLEPSDKQRNGIPSGADADATALPDTGRQESETAPGKSSKD